MTDAPFLLAFGDSLTAGYGLAPDQSFGAQLETMLRDHAPGAVVQNAGVSGDTTASALARLPRLLSSLTRRPDLAIVELGANDLLRGIPLDRTRANLDIIVTEIERCGIPVLLAAMEAPRFLGTFAARCDAVYAGLAAKHGIPAFPFFPSGVLGHRALTLADRIHPNAEAIRMVATAALPAVLAALRARDAAAA